MTTHPKKDSGVIYDRIGRALGQWIVRHRWTTLALSMGFFCLFALGLPRAHFSTDYRIFFSKDDSGLAAFQKLENVFTKTDNVLLVVKAKTGTVFQARTLAAVRTSPPQVGNCLTRRASTR